MKYVFIFNPAAGKIDPRSVYGEQIETVCRKKGLDHELISTTCRGHATELAAKYAEAATAEAPVRIFSVGGDGTLCEVANGLIDKPNCELGIIPCGSGNDYIKTFGQSEDFFDFENYLCSGSVAVDCISTTSAGVHINSLNIASLGFDANVCNTANELKSRSKRLSSSKAYIKAIIRNFFRRLYNELTVTVDDGESFSGKYLFSLAANGKFYGGGWQSAPIAEPTDGKLELILVKNLSRLKFLTIVGSYQDGSYFYNKKLRRIITHRQGKKMSVVSKRPAIVNVDGECFPCSEVTFEIIPSAVRFIVPEKYLETHMSANAEKDEPALAK